jgi:uncharacterized delta-60 repeat protein
MLKLPSCTFGKLSRLFGGGWRRACAAMLVAGAALSAIAQTPPPPTVQFTSGLYAVNENAGSIRVAISRLGDPGVPFSVTITASEPTGNTGTEARSGQDFIGRTAVLRFAPNEVQKTFDVFILDNGVTNVSKFINLTLSDESGATLGAPNTAQIEIRDDETGVVGLSAGVVEFSRAYYVAHDSEGLDGRGDLYPGAKKPGNAEGIFVTVVRRGGARGAIQVDVETIPAPQTWLGPQARTNVHYIPVKTTLNLADYQMSANFIIPTVKYVNFFSDVFYNSSCVITTTNAAGEPIWFKIADGCPPTDERYFPFFVLRTNINNFTHFDFYDTNSVGFFFPGFKITPTFNFQIRLSNVRAHPSENGNIIKPSLGNLNTADAGVVWVDSSKIGNNISPSPSLSQGFSFERAHSWVNESGGVFEMMVNRDARVTGGTFVRYWANNLRTASDPGDHQYRTFPLNAGSDYAHPFADYLPPATVPWGQAVGETNRLEGRVDWSPIEFGPKPVRIPIVNDNLVEFNEDIFVELFHFVGDSPMFDTGPSVAPPALGPFFSSPWSSILTINFDNQYDWLQRSGGWVGAEQPAGAVDRRYNRDNESYIDPPFNRTPGANNSVLAVGVQQDGRLVLGGEFLAVNTFRRSHIARMTAEGQIDKTYDVGTGTDQAVTAIAIQEDGKAIIGGPFTSYNGVLRAGLARLNLDGSLDSSFNPGLGANRPVNAIAIQADGKILVGGEFTTFNGNPANYLTRLNSNGSLDTTFDIGSGPNDGVYSIAYAARPKIIELDSRLVDTAARRSDTYDVGSTEGNVFIDYDLGGSADTIEVLRDGVVIASAGPAAGPGSLSFNLAPGGSSYITIALNRDLVFQDYFADWSYKMLVTPRTDDRLVIGGRFTAVNGVPRNRIARLNFDGSVDTTFNPGFAAEDGVVYSVVKHGRKVYAAGTFSFFDRQPRKSIVGLNENGSVDLDFDPGTGFNDIIYSLIVDSAGRPVAGGLFTEFNGARRLNMARLKHNGKLDTSFMDTAYNQFAGLPNRFSWQPENFVRTMTLLRTTNTFSVSVTNVTPTDTNIVITVHNHYEDQIFIGGSFTNVGGGFRRDDIRPRFNFARIIGGATEGPGTVELERDQYFADENSGTVFITTFRDDGHLGATAATFDAHNFEQGPGAATDREDYVKTNLVTVWNSAYDRSRQVSEAFRGPNNAEYFVSYQDPSVVEFDPVDFVNVTILEDSLFEGDEELELTFQARPTTMSLGGEPIPTWPATGRSKARLTIVDNDFRYGVLGFAVPNAPGTVASPTFYVSEDGRFATITLTRTNGSSGVVSVDYRTLAPNRGGTASPWDPVSRVGDFDPVAGTVTFGAGETNITFTIPIRDDSLAEFDETVLLELRNPTGGATLGATAATLVIVDNDFAAGRMGFQTNAVTVSESDGAVQIVVQRVGGTTAETRVTVNTADDTARAGIDYVGITNLVLTWPSGVISNKVITIPIIDQNVVDTNRVFKVVLSNPTVSSTNQPAALGNIKEIAVNILDNDSFGNLRFSQPSYAVDENGTNATVTVVRVGGLIGDMRVDYSATPQLAVPGQDFEPVSGTLIFTNNQRAASFTIPISDDAVVDGNKTILLNLSNATNNLSGTPFPGTLAQPSTDVVLTIIDNELENIPAGSLDATFLAEGANDFIYTVALQADQRLLIGGDFSAVNSVLRNRLARLYEDGTLDENFSVGVGPNASVRSIQVQEDRRIVVAGDFTSIAGVSRNYIARLTPSGNIDFTFEPGAGANNPIYAMIIQPDGKILIGGNFSAFGPTERNGVARLNVNGTLDTSFNPGTGAAAAGSAIVYALAQQLDGKVIVGGDFTSFNGVPARGLVRLNSNGSVDTTFNTSVGANGSVRSLAIQPDGQILVGGTFTSMQGRPANSIARLNTDGTIDATFNPSGSGANGPVLAINVQIDGKIVLGGDFGEFNGVTRRGITRLNPNGSNDPTINFGTGVNGSVAAVAVQPDRKIILAGGFTEYDGQPRLRLARINGGTIAGGGRFEFVNSTFIASEAGTNVLITVRRTGGTAGSVRMNYSTQADPSAPADATATPGQDYTTTSGTLVFAEGETQATFKVPIANDILVENEEIFSVVLTDPPGEPTRIGDQPTASVVIVSDDSEIFFSSPAYSISESTPSGTAPITISRSGSVSVPATIELRTSDGTATAPADYAAQTTTIAFGVGESQRNVAIGIVSDQLVEGNEFLNLTLSNPSSGARIRTGGGAATLTIVDDDFAPGEVQFQRPTYSVREGTLQAQVAVIRTNGLSRTVTVEYQTSPGTATPDQDYTDASGILTFNDGEGLKFINIPIADDDAIENNETINIKLSNVTGGGTLGLDSAVLTIIDDDLGSGSLDTSFDPGTGANGPIRAIEYDGQQRYLLGGDFTAYNNDTNRNRIARIAVNGPIDPTFSTNNRPNGGISALALQADRRIIIGGSFNTVQGQIENRVARLLQDGPLDTSFFLPLGLDAQVSSVAIQPGDGKIIIGGAFSFASAATRKHIARLNPNGTVDVSFDPGTGADNNVHTVALQSDGKVLIGGQFGSVNGIGAGRIARLNADGSVDTSFRTGTGFSRVDGRPAVVYDILVLSNGRIIVVGDFTHYNGTPRAGVAMLDSNGLLQSFAAGLQSVNGAVRTIAQQRTDRNNDDKFIIGGDFTAVDGTPRGRLARLDASGRFDPSFDPGDGANDSVLGIFVQPWDGRVVVVGAFTEFNNNPNFRGIARVNNDKAFLPPAPTEIRIGSATLTASGGLRLTFEGAQGVTYVVEGTNDFVTWTDDRTVTGAGPNTSTEITTSGNYRFFRIRRQN